MGPRVALVVARDRTELFGDGPPIFAAFQRLGLEPDVVPWDDRDWSVYDGVVIRGTWDYVLDRGLFLSWAAHVASVTRLANSVDVLRWNTDKRYLQDLSAGGIPVVPTIWVEPGDPIPAPEWQDFVVKPSVSAGARWSARYGMGDDIADHVATIHAEGATAMVQPYLASVDEVGETGTYVFGGEVSHAIGKGGILVEGRAATDSMDAGSHQQVGPREVSHELADFARAVLAAIPPVLYARVDTTPGPDGSPLLIELEVCEPYLFLEHAPASSADLFAGAVAAWLAA